MKCLPRLTGGCLLMALAALASCTDIHALDREAARLIDRRESMALGDDPWGEASIVPEAPRVNIGDRAYDQTPPTTNAPLEDLPAVTDPAPGRDPANPDAADPVVPEMNVTRGEPMPMMLGEILEYAIEHGRTYRSRKEDLYLTALDLLIERHLWGPRFFNDVVAQFEGTPEAGDHDQVFSLLNDFRVTQRLPYGGEVSVGALVNFVSLLQNASDSASPVQDAAVTFSAVVPLLRGAGLVAREDLIQAERNLIYATRDFERFRREYFVQIAIEYFNLIAQQERIANLGRQVEGLERLARRFERLAEAGRSPFFEAEQAAAEVLFARNNLTNAEESYATAIDSFKLLIGMPVDANLVIMPSEIVVPEPILDTEASVQTALAYRLDLQTVADRIEDAARQVAIAKNNRLPDLDLFADAAIVTDPDREVAGARLSLEDSRYAAGVRFGAPLDRRIETVRYRQSLVNYERSERSLSLERDRVSQQVRSAIRQIRQARFTLELQERNVALAIRRKQGVLLRERELSPREVIEAEEDLLEARNRRDSAIRDLRISVLQYLLDTGQMRVRPDGRWLPPAQLVPLPAADAPPAEEVAP